MPNLAPIRIHPENPKLFEFRGEPLVLLCATEHYGSVLNRKFRYERYLADHAEKKQTLSRLFLLFRELQSAQNPYSSCKPESTDYISPYPRSGQGVAWDVLPKYDLDQWNPEFFERLHGFLSLASDYGVIVEVVILSNTYNDDIWNLNPLNAKNNINDVETVPFADYMTQRHPKLFERQKALVRKAVEEINPYDNVIIEICNEPGGNAPGEGDHAKPEEVNDWQRALAQVIRETEAGLPNQHLIVGQEAFTWSNWAQTSDLSFGDFFVEVVNIHPLPGTHYQGKEYDMGTFMSKQLKLQAVRDYCLATYPEKKPLNLDEDNVASRFKDFEGWTIHRKRAWTTLLSGAHYDYIDFSLIPWLETGTPESQAHIRTWFKHLSEFVHSLDLIKSRPLTGWLREKPEATLECVFAVEGEDYIVYLADQRETTEEGAGDPIEGKLVFDLPEGEFEVASYSPVSGKYSSSITTNGGEGVEISLPEFVHDIAIRIRKT
jgi:hypothetical protein